MILYNIIQDHVLIGNTLGLIPWWCLQIEGILNISTNVSVCTLYVGVQFCHLSSNCDTLDLVILFLKEHDMSMQWDRCTQIIHNISELQITISTYLTLPSYHCVSHLNSPSGRVRHCWNILKLGLQGCKTQGPQRFQDEQNRTILWKTHREHH